MPFLKMSSFLLPSTALQYIDSLKLILRQKVGWFSSMFGFRHIILCSDQNHMECIPDEIIGEILSCLLDPRDVVVASTACKRWRRVMQFHLKSLSFDLDGLYHGFESHRLETIITQTIMQTKRLETLSIHWYDGEVQFFAASVHAWLMHTKYTLRALRLSADIYPRINIFEKCQWKKLEFLLLDRFSFPTVRLCDMETFPCLKTLSLFEVEVSALNLSDFIALCPKITRLSLVLVEVGSGARLEWFTDTLKHIAVSATYFERFVLEADRLESLGFRCCEIRHFKLVGNEALEELIIYESKFSYFDVGKNVNNLENVNVGSSKIERLALYRLILKSSNLRKLRLWPVTEGFTGLETISASFPQLTDLSLEYLELEGANLSFQGSSLLQNLVKLELGFASPRHFSDKIGGFLDKCPNLKKITILTWPEGCGELQKCLPELSSFLVQLGRKYPQVEFESKSYKAGF